MVSLGNNFDLRGKKVPREQRSEAAMFLVAIITVLLISKSIDRWVLINAASIDIYSNAFVWLYTVVVCMPMIAYLWWLKKPLRVFGVTLNNWRKSLEEGVVISIILLVFGAFVLTVISTLEGKSLTDNINWDWLKFETLAYIPHSIIQEFMFRGVVLTTLVHLFRAHSVWLPLLLSNLLFSFLHMHLGLVAIAMTFLMGYLFSWMYLRHHSILGISIVHIILGSAAFAFGVL